MGGDTAPLRELRDLFMEFAPQVLRLELYLVRDGPLMGLGL
jgi:hypothetical protein